MLPRAYVSPRSFAAELGLPDGSRAVLGLSGGADSVSLLDMLLEDGIAVTAVHINHGIRGEEADRDEEFCRAVCEKRNVKFIAKHINIPALAAERGEGTEECARNERYRIFEEIMKETGCPLLVTAHNADDNAETLLFNLARGSAAAGGCGIPKVRRLDCGYLVRPMLGISKQEVFAYCRERGLDFVTDSTNADTAYSRNRIRANVMPELKKINPGFTGAAADFCESLRQDCDYLDGLARGFCDAHPSPRGCELAKLPVPVASRVLVRLAREAGSRPERIHIKTLLSGIYAGQRVAVSLPGGIIASVSPRRPLDFRAEIRKK